MIFYMNTAKIKTFTAAIIPTTLVLVLLLPAYTFAASLVPCNGTTTPCNYAAIITLIKNIVNFLLFGLAVPLAAISFAVAGVMILTAGGNSSQVERAKEIFWNVVIGLVVALSAWLIVNAILLGLGATGLASNEYSQYS